jgi:hypothetical protein
MCNPQPKVNRNVEVTTVYYNSIAYHKKQVDAGVIKATNCVMLHQMDFRSEIPTKDQLEQWAKGWELDIKEMLTAPKNPRDIDKVADNTKSSYICVPMRILGRWIMVTCDMGKHNSGWITFEDWDWKKVEYFVTLAAAKI